MTMRYTREDVDTMMNDTELMRIVKTNKQLNNAIDDLSEKIGVDSLDVELTLRDDGSITDERYNDDYNRLNELNNKLDWLMVRYCAFNQCTRDELESMMFYLED